MASAVVQDGPEERMEANQEERFPRERTSIVAPSRIEEVVKIRKVIGTLLRLASLSDDDILCLELAVGEGLSNAVRHGSPHGEEDTVAVTYEHYTDDSIEVVITDCGDGFDLQKRLNEVKALTLKEGERGLLLIAALADEVEYHRTPQGRGNLTIRKRISSGERAHSTPGTADGCVQNAGFRTTGGNGEVEGCTPNPSTRLSIPRA